MEYVMRHTMLNTMPKRAFVFVYSQNMRPWSWACGAEMARYFCIKGKSLSTFPQYCIHTDSIYQNIFFQICISLSMECKPLNGFSVEKCEHFYQFERFRYCSKLYWKLHFKRKNLSIGFPISTKHLTYRIESFEFVSRFVRKHNGLGFC